MKRLLFLVLSAALCLFPLTPPACATLEKGDYVRGVWVSSVYNMDFPSAPGLDADKLRAELDKIIENCVNTGMNTIFFQVRPCADALYSSDIFPASVFLNGKSSYDPLHFDPLEYIISEAHKRRIELHAWINPYRVTCSGKKDLDALCEQSPAKLHPEYLLFTNNGNCVFNPALPQVRELVLAGVEEIIENYDVDGIHFDDYFYPEGSYDDSEAFAEYGADFDDIGEWRVENVNTLVRMVHELVKSHDPALQFGISPRGVWANDYDNARGSATRGGGSLTEIYCDSLRFIDEGWVDYICPQLYWSIGYSAADYSILARWWANAVKGSGVRLYIGMADYRSAEATNGSVWSGTEELRRQLDLNKGLSAVGGEVHFRYGSIADNSELYDFYHSYYDVPGYAVGMSVTGLVREKLLRVIRGLLAV